MTRTLLAAAVAAWVLAGIVVGACAAWPGDDPVRLDRPSYRHRLTWLTVIAAVAIASVPATALVVLR